MGHLRGTGALAAVLSATLWLTSAAAAPPRVVASIGPLHSLAANVMAGIATPDLLVKGTASPHSYALRPSEARLLDGADLVLWAGPELESFLRRPLASLRRTTRVLRLGQVPGVDLLPAREGGARTTESEHRHNGHTGHDPHIWLDPGNAAAMVTAIAAALGDLDPANAAHYAANAEAARERLTALTREVDAIVAPVRDVPFVVFHDAYQYFERRFGLNAVGAIVVDPSRKPGARRLYEIRRAIVDSGAACVFREPQFEPQLAATVVEGTTARIGALDPLGIDLEPGPEAYFKLIRNMGRAAAVCLTPAS